MQFRKYGILIVYLCVAMLLVWFSPGAQAQRHGGGADFHGRSMNSFNGHERALWRGGNWSHDWHDGRYAWWWTVGGVWYFYTDPIYPYPTFVPPAIVLQQAPPVPTGLPPAQFWYFCNNPQGYYPYVASCNGSWREVPVTPPQSPQMPQQ